MISTSESGVVEVVEPRLPNWQKRSESKKKEVMPLIPENQVILRDEDVENSDG